MKNFSTIFLDWNKTLSHSKFWGHWQKKNHQHHHIFKDIQSSFFSISSLRIRDWMRGKYTTEELVQYVAEHTKQNYDLLLKEFIQSCEQMEYSSPYIPNLIKQLQAKGMKVVIATDNMDSFTRWTVPSMKLNKLFDGILNSYNLKVLKTDTDDKGESLFFKKFLEENTLNPKNCVLIDDNLDIEPIMKKSKINFLHANKEKELEKHLLLILDEPFAYAQEPPE